MILPAFALLPALLVAPRLAPPPIRRSLVAMSMDPSVSSNFTAGDAGRVTPTNIEEVHCGRVVPTVDVSAPQRSKEPSRRVGNDRPVSFKHSGERVQTTLCADADHYMNVEMELWHGTDTLSYKLRTSADHGHPLCVVVETPDDDNVLTVYNRAQNAGQDVFASVDPIELYESQAMYRLISQLYARTTQCSLSTYFPFGAPVESVLMILDTKRGEPLNARVELLNSTGSITQVVEVYSANGHKQPLECVLKTPGMQGYVVRIINTSPGKMSVMKSVVTPHSFVDADIDVF